MSDEAGTTAWEGIAIVGAGIKVPDQLTIEGLRTLREAFEIWTNVAESEHAELGKAAGQFPHSLWPFYQPERVRVANYEAVTAHLLVRAAAVGSVAYLTQGHPLVLDRVARNLLAQARQGGVSVTVVPGISSIDTILADVGYEPARGLQVFDATNFVRYRMKIDPRSGLMLLQPGVFGIERPRLRISAPPPDLSTLREALCKTYDAAHPAMLIRSATATMAKSTFRIEIGKLAGVPPEALAASTLWVPPVDDRRPNTAQSDAARLEPTQMQSARQ